MTDQEKRIEDVVERIVTEAMEMDIVSHEEADTLETIVLNAITALASEREEEVRREERERILGWMSQNSKEISDPHPFGSEYTYADFIPSRDLADFLLNPSDPTV